MSLSTEHFHEGVSMKSDYPSGLYELTCPFSSWQNNFKAKKTEASCQSVSVQMLFLRNIFR